MSREMSTQWAGPAEVMLIEDNEGDIRLMKEIFSEFGLKNQLRVANDGEQALQILKDKKRMSPDLIILDLNMPRKDGRQVLTELKNDPTLRRIPVVILTTSKDENDIASSYDLHVNCYILKPVDLDQFIKVVREIEVFWLEIARLPKLTL